MMKQAGNSDPDLVFSHPVHVDEVRESGLNLKIEAGEAERTAIAASLGLEALAALTAEVRLTRLGKGGLRLQGDLHATVTYISVVSLEPFDAEMSEPLDVRFAPQSDADAARRTVEAKL